MFLDLKWSVLQRDPDLIFMVLLCNLYSVLDLLGLLKPARLICYLLEVFLCLKS